MNLQLRLCKLKNHTLEAGSRQSYNNDKQVGSFLNEKSWIIYTRSRKKIK